MVPPGTNSLRTLGVLGVFWTVRRGPMSPDLRETSGYTNVLSDRRVGQDSADQLRQAVAVIKFARVSRSVPNLSIIN